MSVRQDIATASRRRRILVAAFSVAAAVAAPALAATSSNTSGQPTQNGNAPAETISLSGSTAMRSFTTSPGITFLNPGTSITLLNGPNGQTTTYTAPAGGITNVQLASGDFTLADSPQPLSFGSVSNASTQNQSAIRLEWHEQGSVEGILEMANDQIGYAGGLTGTPLIDPSTRNPIYNGGNAFSNPIWVNRNAYNGTTQAKSVGTSAGATSGVAPLGGLSLANSDYNTYNTSVVTSTPVNGQYTYNAATGANLQGGTNRVQMAISDVNAVQGFSMGGSTAAGSFNSTPQTTGYGKGNNAVGLNVFSGALPTNALVTPGSAFQLRDQTVLNMPTTNIDPQTGQHYATGAWNNAGLGNVVSTRVAVTATTFVANPGTGLTHVNSSDMQWLQMTGRLQNGADFNMTTRDVTSGTRNVAANNTGIDPSFAVGENDAGNGYVNTVGSGIDAQSQLQIGGATNGPGAGLNGALTAPLFSNKSTGGQLRATVQNSRMAIGTLGIADAITSSGNFTLDSSNLPLRVLAYADTAGKGAAAAYVQPNASTITDGSYVVYQNEQYVTVKAPDAQYASANPNIKGDNSNGDVAAFKANVINSVTNFPATSIADPADQLLKNGFILPQMMVVEKPIDGVNQSQANPTYNATLRTALLNSSYAQNFATGDASAVTSGTSSIYGGAGINVHTNSSETIAITSQNYLFGNFNQNGVRDLSAVQTGLAAAKALYNNATTLDADHGTSMWGGDSNATKITNAGLPGSLQSMPGQRGWDSNGPIGQQPGASKGDLIVMGDYNGDGKFNGADLLAMARGAALSDAAGGSNGGYASGTLTSDSGSSFGDQLRNGVLRKNAALAYMQANTADATYSGNNPTNASAFLRQTAIRSSAAAVNDPTGSNAFNRFDVNGDGLVSKADVQVVDYFLGQAYDNLSNQLSATINTDGTRPSANPAPGSQTPFNLVMAKLYDPGDTAINPLTGASQTETTAIGLEDLKLEEAQAGIQFVPGDSNFDGKVDSTDISTLLRNLDSAHPHGVETGDFNGDGQVNSADISVLLRNLGGGISPSELGLANQLMTAGGFSAAEISAWDSTLNSVPEPGAVGVLALAAAGLLRRRRMA